MANEARYFVVEGFLLHLEIEQLGPPFEEVVCKSTTGSASTVAQDTLYGAALLCRCFSSDIVRFRLAQAVM